MWVVDRVTDRISSMSSFCTSYLLSRAVPGCPAMLLRISNIRFKQNIFPKSREFSSVSISVISRI